MPVPSATPEGSSSPAAYKTRFSEKWQSLSNNTRGICWALLATFLMAVMSTIIKLLGDHLHVTQILMLRQFFMLAISAPVVIKGFPGSLKTQAPLLHLGRILLAAAAMYLGFTAVIHLPLAESTVIGFARTFFITIFAVIFLKEVIGVHRISATLLGFIGVMVIVQPGTGAEMSIYSAMAIFASACAALVGIILRKVTQLDRPITILTFQATFVGLIMAPFGIYNWAPISVNDAILLLCLAGVSWGAQMCNIQALRFGEASAIAPFDYIRLVYAAIISIVIFGVWPLWTTYLGGAIIVAASLYTLHRETVLGKKVATGTAPSKTH
ncbi:Riboflavin transporter [Pseudovibrio axinellae]|uniref:Riboflavin transporter n=1 Tax=Pseudovibrio axinellae TaxID=989403 RepID=A0A166APZ0_9HYPH|nr:DMT family transporter [Pseudovibrio axinellae]KZL21401.1 Riboflavin transporter [Pseudovibrio axinellae]SEQ98840.1 Permease of the drug/metabolite transporter (DMT) superfamily [Pseudovibrio axinellae]